MCIACPLHTKLSFHGHVRLFRGAVKREREEKEREEREREKEREMSMYHGLSLIANYYVMYFLLSSIMYETARACSHVRVEMPNYDLKQRKAIIGR